MRNVRLGLGQVKNELRDGMLRPCNDYFITKTAQCSWSASKSLMSAKA